MQIFPRSLNRLPAIVALAAALGGAGVTFVIWYYFSPWHTQVGYAPRQPIPYSHRLHAGQLGIDCRYCHVNVERSPLATVPQIQTCMNCHAQVRTDSPVLAPLRAAWERNQSIQWVRIHRLPDHAYFDHSIHISANIGCASCHGRVDQMDVVRQERPLSMGWCLECHRDPSQHLRPSGVSVTDMEWQPTAGQRTVAVRSVNPPTHCSGCHR